MYFSRTFKALNFDFQIQGLSRTFKVRANPATKWPLQDLLMQLSCTSTWWLDFFKHVICNKQIITCSEPDIVFIHGLSPVFI